MKLPSLSDVSFENTAVAKKHLYRVILIIQFPQLRVVDGGEVSKDDRLRAEVCICDIGNLANY